MLRYTHASAKVLDEAMKLPVGERVRVAEKLLASAAADGFDADAAINADRSIRGLSLEEARRIVAGDSTDDER